MPRPRARRRDRRSVPQGKAYIYSTFNNTIITITDGRFEFSRLDIRGNGRLVLTGSQPGRVYSRGELIVDGLLDCTGETTSDHQSNSYNDDATISPETAFGGAGGAGG